MTMNIPVIFQFLKDLAANNNREWFNEHRDEYETARLEFDKLLAAVISRIALLMKVSEVYNPKIVPTAFIGIPVLHWIKLRTKFILADISMPRGKSLIIVDIMCTFRTMHVCWQVEAFACLPIS